MRQRVKQWNKNCGEINRDRVWPMLGSGGIIPPSAGKSGSSRGEGFSRTLADARSVETNNARGARQTHAPLPTRPVIPGGGDGGEKGLNRTGRVDTPPQDRGNSSP